MPTLFSSFVYGLNTILLNPLKFNWKKREKEEDREEFYKVRMLHKSLRTHTHTHTHTQTRACARIHTQSQNFKGSTTSGPSQGEDGDQCRRR